MRRLLPVLLTLAVLLGSAGGVWNADFQRDLVFSSTEFSATEGWSANFQRGLDAADRGDFLTALREWTPIAEQGHTNAQFNLGLMYDLGRGVPKGADVRQFRP